MITAWSACGHCVSLCVTVCPFGHLTNLMLIHLLSSLRHYDCMFVCSVGCMAASNLILVFVVLHLVTSEVLCMYES